MYSTSQAYLSFPQMTLPEMMLDLTLVMVSELVAAVVVGGLFSAAFVGNWWQRRSNCFEASLRMTTMED